MDDVALKNLPKEFYSEFTKSSDIKPTKELNDAELELQSIPKITGIKFCIANDTATTGSYNVLLRCDQLSCDIVLARHPTIDQAVLDVYTHVALLKS